MKTPTAEAIDGLANLESCIAEELRLWTPVPILLRRVRKSFSLCDGVDVDAGEQILFHGRYRPKAAV